MEALGRPNIGEAEPTHPQESEMGYFGYGPPPQLEPEQVSRRSTRVLGVSHQLPAVTAKQVRLGF